MDWMTGMDRVETREAITELLGDIEGVSQDVIYAIVDFIFDNFKGE